MKKAIYFGTLPQHLNIRQKFNLVKEAGYDGVEIGTSEKEEVKRLKEEADRVGIEIHSIMNPVHWKSPLTSPDPKVREECVKGIEDCLEAARIVGADAMLLVPGVVNEEVTYQEAYERSLTVMKKKVKPMAEVNKVTIAIENVWNKFLLSPLEFARFIDEIDSAYVKAYFDVGNIVAYGYPEQWIEYLGQRIKKVHIKGFHAQKHDFCYLLEGTINWEAVRKALEKIGYEGYVTAEMPVYPHHPEQMVKDTVKHMDLIFNKRSRAE